MRLRGPGNTRESLRAEVSEENHKFSVRSGTAPNSKSCLLGRDRGGAFRWVILMTSLAISRAEKPFVWNCPDVLWRGLQFAAAHLRAPSTRASSRFKRDPSEIETQTSLCSPLLGEQACACASSAREVTKAPDGDFFVIEGWIAFPTAIADGTATGTVFLEANRQEGSHARVVANLAVDGAGIQNWIHFRMPFTGELEFEGAYGLRATLVATDAHTGNKRLFGTTRAAPLYYRRSEAGIILELEDWG